MTRARVRSLTSPTSDDAGGDLAQLREMALELLPGSHAELGGEAPVALLDGPQLLLLRLPDGRIEQPLQPIGDAG